MATNLDKSLDDIIAAAPRRKGGRGGNKGARGNGGIRKTAGKGRGGNRAVNGAVVPATGPAAIAPALEVNDKIIISNLPNDVQESAIKDYFKIEIGPVRKCTLNYNSKGQSTGVVSLTFVNPGDAAKAWKRFNGTPIDGGKKIMHVELVVDPNKKTLASRIQPRKVIAASPAQGRKAIAGAPRGGAAAGRGGRRGGAARGGAPKRVKKTVEELDAEMADYFVQKS